MGSRSKAADAYLDHLCRKAAKREAERKAVMAHWWRRASRAPRRRHGSGR